MNDVHAGFVVGCGVVVNFLRLYYSEPRPGPVTATRLLVRLVASAIAGTSLVRGVFRRVEADVDCDDERVPFRTFTVVLAGTITHVALGFKPMYLAARKRRHFHLLAGPIGPLRLARKIVRFHRGFPLEEPDFYDNLARRVTIRFATPTGFMMDGDVLDPVDTLTITTGPLDLDDSRMRAGRDCVGLKIGIIGGSGLYEMDGLTDVREVAVETPFGAPSDAIVRGALGDARAVLPAAPRPRPPPAALRAALPRQHLRAQAARRRRA